MATIRRIPVVWSGLTGLPGVSVWYSLGASDATADIKAFYTAVQLSFPNLLTWAVPSSGDTLNDADGSINGTWTGAGSGTVNGTGGATASYAAGCGAYVQWATAAIVNRRRLKGRTFLCPIINTAYDGSGTINGTNLSAMQTAASGIVTGAKCVIWHRPSPGASNGSSSLITGSGVPDQVTSLRTRRR